VRRQCNVHFHEMMTQTAILNLVLSLNVFSQGCKSGVKTGGVVSPGVKFGDVMGTKISTEIGAYHRIEGIIPRIFIQLFLFLKSHHFWKVFSSRIPVHYIEYDNILWRPHNPPPIANLGVVGYCKQQQQYSFYVAIV